MIQNDSHSHVLINMAVVILSILEVIPENELKHTLIQSMSFNQESDSFAIQWLYVLMNILTSDLFPLSWLIISCSTRVSVQKALNIIGEYLIGYTPLEDGKSKFDQNPWFQLWSEFVRCCLSLIHIHHSDYIHGGLQHQLVLDRMGSQVISRTCTLVKQGWDFLSLNDSYKPIAFHLIPAFVGPFLEMVLTNNDEISFTGMHILFSMIVLDFEKDGNFKRVQDIIFEQMPWIMEKRIGVHPESHDVQIVLKLQELFSSAQIEETLQNSFQQQGRDFMSFLETFLSLISEIHDSTSGSQNEDGKIDAMMKMIQFLGSNKINRPNMMCQFIQSLYDLHLSCDNSVEAGMLLKCFADSFTLNISFSSDSSDNDTMSSNSLEERQDIYWQSLELFERGNAWERAIEVCKTLQELFIKHMEYSKWSMILRRQADLVDKITNQERYFANYYRVSFYGNGFPSRIREKSFVYKGLEWEKLGSFCDRILNRYPGSKIIQSIPSSLQGQERLIHVTWIDPLVDTCLEYSGQTLWPELILEKDSPIDTGPKSAHDILSRENENGKDSSVFSYYKSNETNIFCCTRPVKKPLQDDHLDVTPEVKECLSPVISTHTVLMNPIENAILAIKKKTEELDILHSKYSHFMHEESEVSPTGTARFSQFSSSDNSSSLWKRNSTISSSAASINVNANPFTMSLNGAIDAPMNGGIPTYKKAFFTEYYKSKLESENKMYLLEMLQQVIDDQVDFN